MTLTVDPFIDPTFDIAPRGYPAARPERALSLSERFECALEGLWMAYQPIVSWANRAVYGYQALVRSHEPSMSSAFALLEAAEHLSAVERLGRCVRKCVAADLQPSDAWSVFVNLHPRDLDDDTLYADDAELVPFSDRVVFGIVERGSPDEVAQACAGVVALKHQGSRVAVGDQGAGRGTLANGLDLAPDFIKLDRLLVRGIDRCTAAQEIVRALVRRSHAFGARVIAVGVETTAERDMLATLGCDLFQGRLWAEPGPGVPEVRW